MGAPAHTARPALNPFMSSDKPSRPLALSDDSITDGSNAAPDVDAAGNVLNSWTSLVDDWWRQQSASLPDELRRSVRATLDQSKAMWALACGVPAAGPGQTATGTRTESTAGPAMAPWQPVLEALRACESNVLSGRTEPARSEEYASAYGAYAGEFAKLNLEVSRRIQDRLAQLESDVGFVDLHRLILEAAEDAYLAHVSSDEFARCQARFVNALLRHARMPRDGQKPASGAKRKA